MDKLSKLQRHNNMAAIRSKDTKPEMIVRKGLWRRGFRYRLNHKRLPGHPDLVLRKYRTCIFVNGCFWHGHNVMYDVRRKKSLRVRNAARFRRPTVSSGWQRFEETRNGTRKNSINWLKWAGTASQYGSVNCSRRNGKKR